MVYPQILGRQAVGRASRQIYRGPCVAPNIPSSRFSQTGKAHRPGPLQNL